MIDAHTLRDFPAGDLHLLTSLCILLVDDAFVFSI